MNNSEVLTKLLKSYQYTHCFYVAGGNIMHILDVMDREFIGIPFVSEYSAAIAAEYFNETNSLGSKAFALVTAGPGLTNTVTAIAGSYLESRNLLVIGGQVKEEDLSNEKVRQLGIQEIDGVALVSSITKKAMRLSSRIEWQKVVELLEAGERGKPGPVFIEIPLNVQVQEANLGVNKELIKVKIVETGGRANDKQIEESIRIFRKSQRPILLIGGGVNWHCSIELRSKLRNLKIPIMTTWNGADRYSTEEENYFGRPNTWGQRYSNILIQQADLVIAVGTRLGLQQTGFNYKEFVPKGAIIQIDIDPSEIKVDKLNIVAGYAVDACDYLQRFLESIEKLPDYKPSFDWLNYCREVKSLLPLREVTNVQHEGFLDPYRLMLEISDLLESNEIVIPSSSGGAMTVCMQTLQNKSDTRLVTNKSLASMGYGLAGAIGAAFANPSSKIVHIEGDGGFAQNLQELGTIGANNLNVKTFILDNEGYASIRMTQRNYFGGKYIGCDKSTGLGLPNWTKLFESYGIESTTLKANAELSKQDDFLSLWGRSGPSAFIVPIHPEQTYYPKISSRVTVSGSMESAPLHQMSPELPKDLSAKVLKYL